MESVSEAKKQKVASYASEFDTYIYKLNAMQVSVCECYVIT